MGRLSDVQQFIDEAKQLTSFAELEASLHGASEALGFKYFALMHHVDDPLVFNAAHVSNYPAAWVEMVAERKYWTDDPVAAACQRTLAGFAWSDLPQLLPLSSQQLEILAGARQAGLGEGFTIPANIPGELSGSVSFGAELGKSLPHKSLAHAHYLGCFAYEAARRLAKANGVALASPSLTTRQFDCVIMIARGKSDFEAARELGLSPDTVHQHVKTAMKRFQVRSRAQLVVHALFSSHITFKDVLNRPIP